MYVLPGALPEEFFLEASEKCLTALTMLVDKGIAEFLEIYFNNPDANPEVLDIVHRYLDEPIKHATFHQELHSEGIVVMLRTLNMDAIAALRSLDEINSYINAIEKFYNNKEYIHPRLEPRSKSNYEDFLDAAPMAYKAAIRANRVYFYTPHAKEVITGLASVVRRRQDIDIAYKGLCYRRELLFADMLGDIKEVRFI